MNRDDDGMTLVELIVAIVVGALVLSLIAVTFINGFTAQRDGVARDAATGETNLVATTLATTIRNSASIRVDAGGARLDATYIAPDGTPECRAWAVISEDGVSTLVYRRSAAGPLPAADATWGPLATGVRGTLASGKYFAPVGVKSVKIGMEITKDRVSISVTDGVTAQATAEESVMAQATTEGRLPCWL